MSKVLVGVPFFLQCVYEDRWGRSYKGPYTVGGYYGWIDAEYWQKLKRFRDYRLSEKIQSRMVLEAGSRVVERLNGIGPVDEVKANERVMELAKQEIKEAMGDFRNLLAEFNVEVGPGDCRRHYMVFGEPTSGPLEPQCTPEELAAQAILMQHEADVLNNSKEWMKSELPTIEELHEQDREYHKNKKAP